MPDASVTKPKREIIKNCNNPRKRRKRDEKIVKCINLANIVIFVQHVLIVICEVGSVKQFQVFAKNELLLKEKSSGHKYLHLPCKRDKIEWIISVMRLNNLLKFLLEKCCTQIAQILVTFWPLRRT